MVEPFYYDAIIFKVPNGLLNNSMFLEKLIKLKIERYVPKNGIWDLKLNIFTQDYEFYINRVALFRIEWKQKKLPKYYSQ